MSPGRDGNQPYLWNRKAHKPQTSYTDGVPKAISPTSVVTSKVEGHQAT